jgi:hypothetical protein
MKKKIEQEKQPVPFSDDVPAPSNGDGQVMQAILAQLQSFGSRIDDLQAQARQTKHNYS